MACVCWTDATLTLPNPGPLARGRRIRGRFQPAMVNFPQMGTGKCVRLVNQSAWSGGGAGVQQGERLQSRSS